MGGRIQLRVTGSVISPLALAVSLVVLPLAHLLGAP